MLELLAAARGAAVTYQEKGATASEPFPAGYHHVRYERRLGAGEDTWSRAVAGLKDWAPQRGSGLIVEADGPVAPGTNVAMAAPLPPIGFAIAMCRVVYVDEADDRFSFAYGTLPLHPATGEERFELRRADGVVTFVVSAFSRPHHPLIRVVSPVARLLQARATKQYLDAMEHAAR
jgi:uncharacterized protein (UPF0548 family)